MVLPCQRNIKLRLTGICFIWSFIELEIDARAKQPRHNYAINKQRKRPIQSAKQQILHFHNCTTQFVIPLCVVKTYYRIVQSAFANLCLSRFFFAFRADRCDNLRPMIRLEIYERLRNSSRKSTIEMRSNRSRDTTNLKPETVINGISPKEKTKTAKQAKSRLRSKNRQTGYVGLPFLTRTHL